LGQVVLVHDVGEDGKVRGVGGIDGVDRVRGIGMVGVGFMWLVRLLRL
jgi:hypothetical protein